MLKNDVTCIRCTGRMQCRRYTEWLEYPEQDRWVIPYGSSGMSTLTYFVRRGAKKVKDRVVERMKRDIESLKYDLESKERVLNGIMDGSVDWNLY